MNNRIDYIDGLKGISTLIVFCSHFVGIFTCLTFLKNVPGINLLLDGTAAVHIFIMLSGFSICCSLTSSKDIEKTVSKIIFKRYLRLAIPIVLPTIFAYIFYASGLCYNQQLGNYTENQWLCDLLPSNISIANFLSSLIFGPISSSLITPLWMMHFIFFGTFLIIPICICANILRNKKYRYSFLLILSIIILKYNIFYFSASVGILIHFYIKDGYNNNSLSRILAIFSLIIICISLFLEMKYIHIIRAFLIIFFVINSTISQHLFSSFFFQYVNKIGYQIYLVHAPILCIWSCFFTLKLGSNITIIVVNFITTLIYVFLFANIFTKIDNHAEKMVNRILIKAF